MGWTIVTCKYSNTKISTYVWLIPIKLCNQMVGTGEYLSILWRIGATYSGGLGRTSEKNMFLLREIVSGQRGIVFTAENVFWAAGNISMLSNTLLCYVWITNRSQAHTLQPGPPLLCIVRGFLTKLFPLDWRFRELGFANQEASSRKGNPTHHSIESHTND